MQSSSQGRYAYQGYQGYPYVNPVVHDVPSVDAQTASRWAHLPRRPMLDGPSVMSPGSSSGSGNSSQPTQSSSQHRGYPGYQGYPYVNPVYNDVSGSMRPGNSGGGSASGNSSQATQRLQTPSNSDTVPPKRDIDENPVVYIDLPEAGSKVSRSITTPDDEEPEFVQDTIMYDPFENRRIDMPKDDEGSAASSESGSTSAYIEQYQNARHIPARPSNLNLASASGSSSQPPASSTRPTSGVPSFMSKESQVYAGIGTDGADGFPLSPIPLTEFPEPPPAYTEVDETLARDVREPPRVDTPRVVDTPLPPRTQVIINEPGSSINRPITIPMNPMPMHIIGHQNIDQKNLICHHCGARVHTIVQKESGKMTHLIACLVFFIFLPFVIIIYLADYFKYKNHYCPHCFKLIGYETPIVGQKLNYVT